MNKERLNQILSNAMNDLHRSGQSTRHSAVNAVLAGLLIEMADMKKLMPADEVLSALQAKMESYIKPVKKLSDFGEI